VPPQVANSFKGACPSLEPGIGSLPSERGGGSLPGMGDRNTSHHAPTHTSTEFDFAAAHRNGAATAATAATSAPHPAQHLHRPPAPAPAQPPAPAPPAKTAPADPLQASVETLKEMFPDVGHESIRMILSNCGSDLEQAANQLSDRPQARSFPYQQVSASPQRATHASAARIGQDIFLDWDMGEVQYYLIIGYLGTGWSGFTYNNDDIKTGQGALLKILYDLDAVREPVPHKRSFTASRTDKGVHAVCLLIQTPMRQIKYGREEEFVRRVNGALERHGGPNKNMRVFAVSMTPTELLSQRDKLEIRDRESCRTPRPLDP
jgi:hypothetical protein